MQDRNFSAETLQHLANRGQIVDVEVEGIHPDQAPDYVDAFIASAKVTGPLGNRPLSPVEIERLPETFVQQQIERATLP